MTANKMQAVAQAVVADGKGILAADESFPTIEKRFKSINIPSTEENRRDYREMLFTTPDVEKYIGGVILFDETIRQKASDGTSLVEILNKRGIVPGIKVDAGAKPLAHHMGEKITEGLDGLRGRLEEYRELGAGFAKWRAVITIADGIPSDYCLKANADALARYAALCQEAGIVPIVEPEVLMDGSHGLNRCEEVTTRTLDMVFSELLHAGVVFEEMLLKPNMVIAGKDCPQQAGVQEVAEATVRTLKRCVPSAVPGVVFLSGGQSSVQATEHLHAMNAIGNLPWALSFSYGRALQEDPLQAWSGKAENVAAGQKAFHHRSKCNALAAKGEYSAEVENAA